MSFRRRGPVPKEPSVPFCLTCIAIGFHRWDCTKVERKYRADGPYGPVGDPVPDDVPAVAALAWRSR